MLHVLYSLLVPNYEKQKSPSHYKKDPPLLKNRIGADVGRRAPGRAGKKLWVEKLQMRKKNMFNKEEDLREAERVGFRNCKTLFGCLMR